MRQYVILGAGAAGIAACEAIRSLDSKGNILLISEEAEGYYSRPGLAYWLSGELPEKMLFPFSDDDFTRLKVERTTAHATRIDLAARQLIGNHGETFGFDSLLIATGSRAVSVDLPNMDAEGIVKLDNLADARRILSLARKARSAVVIGGGITALEIVEGLLSRGLKPHYFLRGDRYWSNVLDERESHLVEHRLMEDGVQIHYHTELAEVATRKDRLNAIYTKDGRELKCDLLAIAIGVRPQVEVARNSGLAVKKGIQVDSFLQTSQPGIFAAGDVAEVLEPQTGQTVLNTLWWLARDQGRIAGLNMVASLDENYHMVPYLQSPPFNVTRLAGLTTTIIGSVGNGRDEDLTAIARGDSETWRRLPDAIAAQSHFKVNRLRVLMSNNTIIGAIVMGDQTLSIPLQQMITKRWDISPILDKILQPNAPLGDILADFWSAKGQ